MKPSESPDYYKLEPDRVTQIGDVWYNSFCEKWYDITGEDVGKKFHSTDIYRPKKFKVENPKDILIKRLAVNVGESKMNLRNLITECEHLINQARQHADPITAVDLEFVLDKFKNCL